MRREDDVLGTRVKDLGLTLEKSRFFPLIREVRRELKRAGIGLDPLFYLSTEYGCLERTATIGLLWTDGFDFARRLARKHGVRTRATGKILRTLRHEVGHAFCYTHQLYRTARFRSLFGVRGPFFDSYPEVWKPGASARKRVKKGEVLILYAARHPDEDFAVSFEFWLTARTDGWDWRRRFRKKPVILAKMQYVEDVVGELRRARARGKHVALDEPVSAVTLTVEAWIESVVNGTNYNLHPRTAVGT